jgi:hypothetical protein
MADSEKWQERAAELAAEALEQSAMETVANVIEWEANEAYRVTAIKAHELEMVGIGASNEDIDAWMQQAMQRPNANRGEIREGRTPGEDM